MGLVEFVIVSHWVRDRDSTEPRALYLFVLSADTPRCLCKREGGQNGLSRLCHITCFFISTIWLRPRLSRALIMSLFSMPDKLSGCRSFRFYWNHCDFFPKNGLIPSFRFFLTECDFKKSSFKNSMVIHR